MSDVAAFMKKYGVAKDEIWPVPGGKAHAIKHSALERIAAEQGITFAPPQIIEANGADKIYSMVVTGKLGERLEWATGEASPHNNKNAYGLAMAEKRGKDRVILKLLAAHGVIYSEEEADDFKEKPASSYSLKKNKPDFWPKLEAAVRAATTRDELTTVWREWRAEFDALPTAWREQVDELFHVQAEKVNDREAAE